MHCIDLRQNKGYAYLLFIELMHGLTVLIKRIRFSLLTHVFRNGIFLEEKGVVWRKK